MEGHEKRTFGGPRARESLPFFRGELGRRAMEKRGNVDQPENARRLPRVRAGMSAIFLGSPSMSYCFIPLLSPLKIYFTPFVCIPDAPFEKGSRRSSFLHFYLSPFSFVFLFS